MLRGGNIGKFEFKIILKAGNFTFLIMNIFSIGYYGSMDNVVRYEMYSAII